MEEEAEKKETRDGPSFAETIGEKAAHRLRGKRDAKRSVWSGLALMGMVGWSVAVPTLLGALAGRWLDENRPGGRSWTLALLAAGLVLGCVNAWRSVSRENRLNRDIGKDEK